MNFIFRIVAHSLNWIASFSGFTYKEINIIAYYIILPFVFVALIDRIIKRHFLKIGYVVGWLIVILLIKDFNAFSNTLFDDSVDFLLLFGKVGLNYVAASVVVCVLLPGAVFAVLCVMAFPSLRRWISFRRG